MTVARLRVVLVISAAEVRVVGSLEFVLASVRLLVLGLLAPSVLIVIFVRVSLLILGLVVQDCPVHARRLLSSMLIIRSVVFFVRRVHVRTLGCLRVASAVMLIVLIMLRCCPVSLVVVLLVLEMVFLVSIVLVSFSVVRVVKVSDLFWTIPLGLVGAFLAVCHG